MNLNWRAFSRIIVIALTVLSVAMIPSLIIAGIYHEKPAFLAFMCTILCMAVASVPLSIVSREFEDDLRIRDGFFIISTIWILMPLIGAMPYMISGAIPDFFSAFFESCSGFSGTGSSILNDIEILPKSILFWRSLTQWIGGIAILLFAISLFPSLGLCGHNVIAPETSGSKLDSITDKLSDITKLIIAIYVLFSIIEVLLLRLGDMSWFDALVHTFSSIGTGGFSAYNDGIMHFDSLYIELVISVFMIIGATNFTLFYLTYKQRWNYFKIDSEFKFYIGLIVIFTLLVTLGLWISGDYGNIFSSLRQAFFQVTSIITTTGFAAADFSLWPTFCMMLLLLLMLIGGCAASTGGGLKVIRVLVLLKLIRKGIATQLHPNAIVNIRLSDNTIPSETITKIANHAFLFIATIMISTLILSLDGFDLITNFSSVIACVSNVGPGFNLAGPMASFSMYSDPAKLLLSFLMLGGRLEAFILIVTFTPNFWRSH